VVTILLKSLLTFAHKVYRHEVATGRLALVMKDDLDNIKRPPGVTRKVGPLWSPEQMGAFLHLARVRYEQQPRATVYPVFYTALAAGLRRGELIGLKRTALKKTTVKGETRYYLDITEQLVDYGGKLHEETPKTRQGTRRVPITAAHAELLRAHSERMDGWAKRRKYSPSPLMFPTANGTPLTPRTLYRALDTLCDDLGLPHTTLHSLRKAYTSYTTRELVKAGTYSPKLMAQLLGHASTDVALEVYTLVVEDDLMSATFDPASVSKKYPKEGDKLKNEPVTDENDEEAA
jgi:integrase